jgi:hypothetical protein
MQRSRGSFRDRHGRGLRRPILGGKLSTGFGKARSFTQNVAVACLFLQTEFADELANLTWRAVDTPDVTGDEVRRWDADKDKLSIVIYRIPLERLGHSKRMDAEHERMHVEQAVFEAAAYLTDSDPFRFYERWSAGPQN